MPATTSPKRKRGGSFRRGGGVPLEQLPQPPVAAVAAVAGPGMLAHFPQGANVQDGDGGHDLALRHLQTVAEDLFRTLTARSVGAVPIHDRGQLRHQAGFSPLAAVILRHSLNA
jgi:hypothetical protein